MGARINGLRSKTLIREESENHAFHSPRSKKPLTDFLRQITTTVREAETALSLPEEQKAAHGLFATITIEVEFPKR